MSNHELLDSLERALQEVEALEMIYGQDGDDDDDHHAGTRLVLKSSAEEMDMARALVESASISNQEFPTIALEMHVQIHGPDESSNNDSLRVVVCLYFALVSGYPAHRPVSVTVLTAQGLSKQAQEELALFLQARAEELIGSEAIMVLVQACQDRLTVLLDELSSDALEETDSPSDDMNNSTGLSRRYIWVHHITDKQRKQDIVQEAREHRLGGYLKAGYPGIVIIEGPSHACDAFTMWIKGNKSRPGGFGRQWGHHVRGELVVTERRLSEEFAALEEDMAVLASVCRERNVEDEFKKFVMQHG